MRLAWCVVDYDGNPLPGTWPSEADAVDLGLCGKYLLSGFEVQPVGRWRVSSSSDPDALAVVDGTGRFSEHGPHYSRRTVGSKTFTGVGQEVVLITDTKDAVWAVVRQKTPARRGSGTSRGRMGDSDANVRHIWRNMLFRNLGEYLSSDLIREATAVTYWLWRQKYGELPAERLRTEIGIDAVRSTNPGYCYKQAGYTTDRKVRDKLYLWAPSPDEIASR
jgi:hypothetical protein